MRYTAVIISAILILLHIDKLQARNFIADPEIVNYSNKEYDAGNRNWSIAQDSRGVFYFANNDGLLEYDGLTWRLFGRSMLRSVAVDVEDRVFTGGFEEFGMWQRDGRGELLYTNLSDSIAPGIFNNEDIWQIRIADEGVYFQSFAKIYFYDYRTVEVMDPKTFILFMHPVGKSYYINSYDRLMEFNRGEFRELMRTGLNNVRVIMEIGSDSILLGTPTRGLYLLSGGKLSRWGTEIDRVIEPYDLNCAIRLENGDFVFGTLLNGIYRTDPQGRIINHLNSSNYLQSNTVLSLLRDHAGNVWAGLDKGISMLDYSNDFSVFLDHTGRIGAVSSAALFGERLYIGTNRGLFSLPWSDFSERDPLAKAKLVPGSQGQIWTLREIDGVLFCGHNKGLMTVTNGTADFLTTENGFFDMVPVEINGEKHIIASTYGSPFLFLKEADGKYRYKSVMDGFMAPCPQIHLDYMGNLWFSHMRRGLYKCRMSENYSVVKKTTVYTNSDLGSEDPHIKFGLVDGRLVFISGNRFYLYNDTKDEMVPYDQLNALDIRIKKINRIVPAGKGYFWLTGDDRAVLLKSNDTGFEIAGQYHWGNPRISTVDGYENICVLNDSLSLVCLDNGFLLHNRNRIAPEKRNNRQVVIAGVYTYDKQGVADTLTVAGNDPVKISYRNNSIRFRFSCPDVSGNDITFQYKLEGLHSEWIDDTASPEVLFERLSHGSYVFNVRAVDTAGRATPAAVYRFTIGQVWYYSTLAIFCYVVFVLGVFALLWRADRIRVRKKHAKHLHGLEKQLLVTQNEQLRTQVKEKEAELFNVTHVVISKNKVLGRIREEMDAHLAKTPSAGLPKRLHDKINGLIAKDINSDDDWKLFAMHFEQNHQGFFKAVKNRYPELTAGDLKLCACLRLNLSTKDIASLLGISVRGVEIGRYRLRKKMGVDSSVNLNDWFIANF